ncbi:hypothetical protein CMUS01_04226 [Colletotrichum musicola]|uniref:Uncharacterized protein n=1 Tax=Colletotrichum musicola TaxID=2175873 RepID=A0A8H6KZ02_9PEZI|nr:hypothetical protein CMUS01_04226 [Colletotrichum musicola]
MRADEGRASWSWSTDCAVSFVRLADRMLAITAASVWSRIFSAPSEILRTSQSHEAAGKSCAHGSGTDDNRSSQPMAVAATARVTENGITTPGVPFLT